MESFCSSKTIFSGISKAFLEDNSFRERFYTYNPESEEDWKDRIDKVSRMSFNREALANALHTINKNLGASQATLGNIKKLRNETTQCIVTGQQTGILGGPLYSLYKAATTIKKAKSLSKSEEIDVVPVFWMASEDHDFEEAREVSLIDGSKIKKVKVDKKPGVGNNNPFKTSHNYSYIKEPVGWIDINTSVKSLMIEARHAWTDTNFKEWCQEVLQETIKEDETLSAWFGRMYLKLFKDEGLIIIDPLNSAIRQLGVDFLKTAMSQSDEIINSVKEAGMELEALGYSPLIKPRDGATGLYYLERGERIPIIHEEGLFTIRDGDECEAFCNNELKTRIESHPEEFSTNVILRPVIQDHYLPTIAYVAGPGEASYYAQLKRAYGFFEKEMPIILPRENYTVCSGTLKEDLSKLGLDVEKILMNDQHAIEKDMLNEWDQIDVDSLFETFQQSFNQEYADLVEKLESIDEDILEISNKNKELITKQFDYLKQKSHRFHRRNYKEELKAIKRVFDWIKPYGGLQERALSPLNIMSQAGPDFIDFIVNELEYDRHHRVITLK